MPETHNLGRLYVTHLKYLTRKHMPFFEKGWTVEVDGKFRRGTSLVIRIPFTTYGIVLGLWGRPGDEDSRLQEAIGCRLLGPLDLDAEEHVA